MFWKLTQVNRKRDIIILAFVAAVMVNGGNATADFVFGEPTNLGPPVNTSHGDGNPFISADGLRLYFGSSRGGGYGGWDLWMTTRETKSDPWGEPVNLGPVVNSSSGEGRPFISADGLSLYFSSSRAGGYGGWDLWMTTRETKSDPWGEPVNLGPTVNSPADEDCPSISADDLELYFGEWQVFRPGGYGSSDLWVTKRPTKDDPWGTPVNLGDTVNSSYFEGGPVISADSLTLFFIYAESPGAGGIWMTRRATPHSPWTKPVDLGPTVNSPFEEGWFSLSANGSTLYFGSRRPGGSGNWDLWQASAIPIVDFNGDGIVDSADMCIMIDHWGENYSLCDIGPMPRGDGIVDVQDLIVLAEHLFTYPGAV
ncbi:MAG: hypothetical protein ACYS74_03485, partial [Planctomycetota bacterium]